ncbi:MAG: DNA modification methylase [Flavobacteriales bacterium]|nr:DNA modification methylase [Flavobacteriales bacterium]MAB95586.1 DNA modification methylase [Flavobacteriales bacterium]|tara:strand:- start:2195 stop:2950 length:756 start_codon:yes stop_codon:yes gene_type:complete
MTLINQITLKQNSCFDLLPKLKPSSVDLILTDPPYEISRDTGFKAVKNGVQRFAISMDFGKWDKNFEGLAESIMLMFQALKNGGTCIIFYDLWKITTLKDIMESVGFKQIRMIEWLKTNPVPINSSINYLTNAREIALVGVKHSKPTFNSQYDNGVYKYPIYHGKDRFHPTQKPLDLFKELIHKHSNEGDVVLDPFSGSGTTALASFSTNRKFIGCEVNLNYYNNSIERLKISRAIATQKQIDIFSKFDKC